MVIYILFYLRDTRKLMEIDLNEQTGQTRKIVYRNSNIVKLS